MSTVSAVIRREDSVLLVQQKGPQGDEPGWFLPGGVVEPGEDLVAALRREVREEAGLTVADAMGLAWVCAVTWRTADEFGEGFSFVFEVADPGGLPVPDDPDGLVRHAEFVEIEDAIRRIEGLPWPRMRDPEVAYLDGRLRPGAVFVYDLGTDGSADVLLATIGVDLAAT